MHFSCLHMTSTYTWSQRRIVTQVAAGRGRRAGLSEFALNLKIAIELRQVCSSTMSSSIFRRKRIQNSELQSIFYFWNFSSVKSSNDHPIENSQFDSETFNFLNFFYNCTKKYQEFSSFLAMRPAWLFFYSWSEAKACRAWVFCTSYGVETYSYTISNVQMPSKKSLQHA